MGQFSIEPPRRHCIAHHTFNFTTESKVVDISPQSTDGNIVGNVTFGHRGVVGQSARLADEDANVVIDDLDTYFPVPSTTIASWSRSERGVPSGEYNLRAQIVVGGTAHKLSHTVSESVTEWQFGALEYDGTTARLYYGRLGEGLDCVGRTRIGGEAQQVSLQFNTDGFGFVDDTRLYRRTIGFDGIESVYKIGSEHQSVPRLKDFWPTPGIPFRGGNRRLSGALAEETDEVRRTLDYLVEARHISSAGGEQLDSIGRVGGILRRENESDEVYRARIQGTLAAGRSSGTFEDLLEATATILETDIGAIELDTDFAADPAKAFVYVQSSDLDNTPLDAADLTAILEDAVLAGHEIEVVEQGTNPFTLINDQQTNDPAKGLTADGIQSGGGLVSDF